MNRNFKNTRLGCENSERGRTERREVSQELIPDPSLVAVNTVCMWSEQGPGKCADSDLKIFVEQDNEKQ